MTLISRLECRLVFLSLLFARHVRANGRRENCCAGNSNGENGQKLRKSWFTNKAIAPVATICDGIPLVYKHILAMVTSSQSMNCERNVTLSDNQP